MIFPVESLLELDNEGEAHIYLTLIHLFFFSRRAMKNRIGSNDPLLLLTW